MSKAVSVPQGTAGHSCRAAGPQWLSGFYFSVDIMWIFFDLRFLKIHFFPLAFWKDKVQSVDN